jgi:uncharacterized protein (TIGR00369 family)
MTTAPETEQRDAGPPRPERRERTFSWTDPAAIAAAGAGMSGAEFFAAISAGEIPPPPITRVLDFDGAEFGEGRAVFRLTPQEFHYNPIGTMHGGVFATLLDSACGCAVHTLLPAGVFYTSLDLSVKFLRPVTLATGPITAEATVVHFGRRTALAEAKITDANGKVYVTATSSCLILRPEQPAAPQ